MAKLVLWFVNRCVDWNHERLQRALARPTGLGGFKHQVRIDNRTALNAVSAPVEPSWPGELMHEGHIATRAGHEPARNEYFVPIAVKCIGDPVGFAARLAPHFRPTAPATLLGITSYYDAYFGPQGTWRDYWTPQDPDRAAMNTADRARTSADGLQVPAHLGLYEVLRLLRRADERVVLVGYSQGGVVARYLAYLDEALVRPDQRVVQGVVTVQSPNAGSPMARWQNRAGVAKALLHVAAAAAGLTTPLPFSRLGAALEATVDGGSGAGRFSIEAVVELLDAAIADFRAFPADERVRRRAAIDLVVTAKKWLSGLTSRAAGTAFNDLDIDTLGDPRSVLGALHASWPPASYEAAVVGANYRLIDLLSSFSRVPEPVLRWMLQEHAARLDDAQRAYFLRAMVESAGLTGEAARIAHDYEHGVQVHGADGRPAVVGAYDHDFVIPAAQQVLGPRGRGGATPAPAPPSFLGNAINRDANHLSGAERKDDAENDEDMAVRFLAAIGDQLAW